MRPDSTRTGPHLLPDYRAVMEAFARYVADEQPRLEAPEAVAALLRPVLAGCEQEEFHALLLNTRNELICDEQITVGLLDRTQIHPREVFRSAIRRNCSRVLLVHNHPGGDPTPSAQDIAATRQLVEAGKIVGIDVLDHVVLGTRTASRTRDWLSFRQENLL
jgi:DNA repair protein RadC